MSALPCAQARLTESFRAAVTPACGSTATGNEGTSPAASPGANLPAPQPCDRRENSQKGVLADDGAFLELSKLFSSCCLAREEPAQNSSWFCPLQPGDSSSQNTLDPPSLSPLSKQTCKNMKEKAVWEGPAGVEPCLPVAPSRSISHLIVNVAKL